MDKFAVKSLVVMLAATYLGVCAALIALALAMPYRVDLLPPVLVTGCAVAGITFCYGMVRLWNDDAPAKPKVAPMLRIEQVAPDKRQLRYEDAPATEDQIRTVATRLYYGARMTHDTMQDVFGDRPAYSAFRDWLVERGYCAWRSPTNPQSGVVVTGAGDEFFGRLYAPPSPTAIVYAQDTVSTPTHRPTQEE